MVLIQSIPRTRPIRILHLGWILVTLGFTPAWANPQEDVARARLVQAVLPNLNARTQRAKEQTRAAQALFNGTGTLQTTFPELSNAPLFSTGFISSEHAALETRAKQRATDRVEPPPAHLLPAQTTQWRTAMQRTLDTEEQSDVARRRILDAIAAGLARAPGLAETQTVEMEKYWAHLRVVTPDATPDQTRLAQAAGQASAQLRQLRAAALRQMLVPGDPTLTNLTRNDATTALPTATRWSAANVLLVEARLERLSRTAPLLEKTDAINEEIEGLQMALIEQALPGLQEAIDDQKLVQKRAENGIAMAPIDELQKAQNDAQIHLKSVNSAAAEAGIDVTQTDGGPLVAYHRLNIALAELRLATAQTRIDRRTHLAQSGLSLDTRATEADIAKAKTVAEAAAKKAKDAANGERSAAQLQQLIADLRAKIATDLEEEGARHDEAVDRYKTLLHAVEEHSQDISVALTLSPLAADRTARIDTAYRSLSKTIREIRTERHALSLALDAASETQESQVKTSENQADSEELTDALLDLNETHASVCRNIEGELDAVLFLLGTAKNLRERIRPRTSISFRISADVLPEVRREISEVPAILRGEIRKHQKQLRSFPTRLTELNAWGEWLFTGFKLTLLLLLWVVIRKRSGSWIETALITLDPTGHRRVRPWQRVQVYPSWVVSGELLAMREPLTSLTRSLADILFAGCLLTFLTPRIPSMGIAAYVLLGTGLVQFVPGLAGLAIITPAHSRPALRVTAEPVRQLILWTVRITVIWLVIEAGLIYIAEKVLDADHLALLMASMGSVVFVFVGLVAMYRWGPNIQHRLRENDGAIQQWAATQSKGPFSKTIRATIGTFILVVQWFIHLIGRIIDRRAGLSWIGAALARRQLKEDEGIPAPAIDTVLRSSIEQIAPDRLENPDAAYRIQSVFDEWQAERRQGMVALIGDRGMGKQRLIQQLRPVLNANMEIVELQLDHRISDPKKALQWLAAQAGIQHLSLPTDNGTISSWAEHTADAIRQRTSTVFVFQNTHRLFLRSVGRFQAMQAVLSAMQACSGHHFWLCAFHGPAWTFLDGIGEVVNLSGFRERVILDPLAPSAISNWLESSTLSAGAKPQYGRLVHRDTTGKEQTRLLDRASRAYWRLLTEASQGNPKVALTFWLEGLRQTADRGLVDIGLFNTPDSMDLDDLGDTDLFTLTALIIHNGATLEELHESLNLPPGEVRSTCRNLESRTIIQLDEDRESFCVTDFWLPAVERLLRRRSFLHRR